MVEAKIKLNELLSKRESLEGSLKNINRLIKQGIEYVKDFPERWYVENPNQNVIDYLSKKYDIDIQPPFSGCGIGELHGEYAFVPADVEYSWKITQEEFDLCLSFSNGR